VARNDPRGAVRWIRIVGGRLAGWGMGDPPRDLPRVDARTQRVLRDDSGRPADGSRDGGDDPARGVT